MSAKKKVANETATKKRRNTNEEILEVSHKKRALPNSTNQMGPAILKRDIEFDEDIIGTGTFSKVYKGIYKGEIVAVKIFKQKVSDEDFAREVAVLRNFTHESIVQFIGYCNFENQNRIVMEYMERGTLFDLLHKSLHEFTWLEKLYLIRQIAMAMEYLHAKNVAHCDLSSKNLLVGSDYEVKISDFGQSENMSQQSASLHNENGKLRGTLRWMSKEILQRESNALDKCDVWSFGVIMFEVGSSTIPYWDLTDLDVRAEIKRGAWPVAKDFKIWMGSKIANKWKLLMDLCFQIPTNRPSFEILNLDIDLLITGIEQQHEQKSSQSRKK